MARLVPGAPGHERCDIVGVPRLTDMQDPFRDSATTDPVIKCGERGIAESVRIKLSTARIGEAAEYLRMSVVGVRRAA